MSTLRIPNASGPAKSTRSSSSATSVPSQPSTGCGSVVSSYSLHESPSSVEYDWILGPHAPRELMSSVAGSASVSLNSTICASFPNMPLNTAHPSVGSASERDQDTPWSSLYMMKEYVKMPLS